MGASVLKKYFFMGTVIASMCILSGISALPKEVPLLLLNNTGSTIWLGVNSIQHNEKPHIPEQWHAVDEGSVYEQSVPADQFPIIYINKEKREPAEGDEIIAYALKPGNYNALQLKESRGQYFLSPHSRLLTKKNIQDWQMTSVLTMPYQETSSIPMPPPPPMLGKTVTSDGGQSRTLTERPLPPIPQEGRPKIIIPPTMKLRPVVQQSPYLEFEGVNRAIAQGTLSSTDLSSRDLDTMTPELAYAVLEIVPGSDVHNIVRASFAALSKIKFSKLPGSLKAQLIQIINRARDLLEEQAPLPVETKQQAAAENYYMQFHGVQDAIEKRTIGETDLPAHPKDMSVKVAYAVLDIPEGSTLFAITQAAVRLIKEWEQKEELSSAADMKTKRAVLEIIKHARDLLVQNKM